MSGARALKERTRRAVHAQWAVSALYRAEPESEWVPVSVRVHDHKQVQMGQPSGYNAAQMVDVAPEIVFLLDEIGNTPPLRGAVVSVAAGEAWTIGESDRGNGTTVTASAAPIPAAGTTSFPVPD